MTLTASQFKDIRTLAIEYLRKNNLESFTIPHVPPLEKINYRRDILSHYGAQCCCCGSSKDLVLDHIRPETISIIPSPPSAHALLIKRLGYPKIFQVLCNRCNSSKNNGSSCNLHYPICIWEDG